jgi:hypothetical protein
LHEPARWHPNCVPAAQQANRCKLIKEIPVRHIEQDYEFPDDPAYSLPDLEKSLPEFGSTIWTGLDPWLGDWPGDY